jgi:3-O-methylgallate 3,4-dioxygenase
MARLAAAFGSSHTLMLTCELDDWVSRFEERDRSLPLYDCDGNLRSYDDFLARVPATASDLVTASAITQRFKSAGQAMDRLRDEITSAKLDVLIIVGDDQDEIFHDTHMPSIGIYYGDTIRNAARTEAPAGDWQGRARMRRLEDGRDAHYPCHGALGLHLIEGLIARGFDIAAVKGLVDGQFEGHAFSFIHRFYLAGHVVPVVPIFLNTYYPPNQPTPQRCLALGSAIADLIALFSEHIRVGILASGGLSHFVVDETLDVSVIDALRRRDMVLLADLNPQRLQAGSSEIRNWICVGAAASKLDLSWVSYIPGYRTPALTGIGLCFARWS